MLDQADRIRTGDDLRSGDGVTVVPYVRLADGEWTIPDETIMAFYAQLQQEGNAENISGSSIRTPQEFLAYLSSGEVFPVLIAIDGSVGGGAWLTHVSTASAWLHFAFLRWAHGPLAERMAHAALAYWDALDRAPGEPVLKVLLGATPVAYRLAVAFVRRVGFTILGEVPYVADGEPMMFSYRVNARLR